jgi:hypothetical protein
VTAESSDGAGSAEPREVAPDELGREPWVGWTPREVPDLTKIAPREVADLIVEVLTVEGPATVGRVVDLLRRASGWARVTKPVRDAVESGIGSGTRRGDLVMASGRHGDPDSRVIRLKDQPDVVLRTPGDRGAWSIPGSELAALAERIRQHDPDLDRDAMKRRLAQSLGWSRYTAQLNELLESVIPDDTP